MYQADPESLRKGADSMISHANDFLNNVKKIYATMNEMVTSNFTSPDAVALANEIEKHHNSMNEMAQIIADYGNFMSKYANDVIRQENDRIDNIRI